MTFLEKWRQGVGRRGEEPGDIVEEVTSEALVDSGKSGNEDLAKKDLAKNPDEVIIGGSSGGSGGGLGGLFAGLGEGANAVDVIKNLGTIDKDMPMKARLRNARAATSVTLRAQLATEIGWSMKGKFLVSFMDKVYAHSTSEKGKRAEEQFEALGKEIFKQFEIDKKSAGKALP